MGVDEIDKADIFDEYFDDDKPKITNFQKIKAMDIDEMAEELYIHLGGCSACACYFMCEKHDIGKHHCIGMYKQWLESEVRE